MNWLLTYQGYIVHLCILICIYLILAQSFNLSFGLGNLFNLAHIASYSIGAYATALCSLEFGMDFFSCILVSALSAALFAILIGAISTRLSQDYFAIGTLAFSSLVAALLINWKSLTRGVLGISGIPRPEFWNINFLDNVNFLMLLFVFVLIVQGILYVFFRNSFSRRFRAQSELEHAALSLGFNVSLDRNWSFMMASACAGLAGSFFSYYINYIDPSSFSFNESVFILSIVVIGRPGSFWGCIMATIFLVLLPEPLRFIDLPSSILGPMRQLLHALILFIVVWINRHRLFPVRRQI